MQHPKGALIPAEVGRKMPAMAVHANPIEPCSAAQREGPDSVPQIVLVTVVALRVGVKHFRGCEILYWNAEVYQMRKSIASETA